MNLITILSCAKMAAATQMTALGHIDPEVQLLIDEVTYLLAPDPVVQMPAEEPAPVVEEPAPVVEEPAPVVEEPAPVVEDTPTVE
jgi:hypothetical protein